MARAQTVGPLSASQRLDRLAQQALVLAKKARCHRKNLGGANLYANKLATLRADATNAFQDLAPASAGDSSAIAALLEGVFSPDVDAKKKAAAANELCYNL